MSITIALAGNPNSGKTTVFNALTGAKQYVGNWPGVTVEKKEGKLKGHAGVKVMDLPGIYSLSPYTLEEVITRDYLISGNPDVILDIVDGTNLERNLYLATQLLEIGLPVVVAINMSDVVEKKGDLIDCKKLSEVLGCKVVSISALKGTGVQEAAVQAVQLAREKTPSTRVKFSAEVEEVLDKLQDLLPKSVLASQKRFYAIKLFERDNKIEQLLTNTDAMKAETLIAQAERKFDDDPEGIIANERYQYIDKIKPSFYIKRNEQVLSPSEKVDRIVTNKWLALPIFAAVMVIVYYIAVTSVGALVTDWTNDVLFGEIISPAVDNFLTSVNCAPWLQGLVVSGIIGGVGAVLGFVPQMLVLFIFLAILEDCGYMSRVAFIMDKLFRKFGLSGKSFIPLLIGTGCGVPAVMASRTIESERDRRMTVMTTTFIPCGAKLPIIALIAGALFGGAWWVAPSAYFIGIAAVVVSGIMLKKTRMFAGDPAPFVMELPAYHIPTAGNVFRSMWERGWSFIKKAGTIVLLSSVIIWFMSNFGFVDGRLIMVEDMNDGLLAAIGGLVAWIFAPLGFDKWQAVAATIMGLVAKENLVSTFGVLYGFGEVAENGTEIWGLLAAQFTAAAAYALLVFNLLCAPCFAAIGAIRREMNNPKWTLFAIGYQTVFAYCIALCFYQFATFFGGGGFTIGTVVAIGIVGVLIFLLVRPGKAPKSSTKALYEVKKHGVYNG